MSQIATDPDFPNVSRSSVISPLLTIFQGTTPGSNSPLITCRFTIGPVSFGQVFIYLTLLNSSNQLIEFDASEYQFLQNIDGFAPQSFNSTISFIKA